MRLLQGLQARSVAVGRRCDDHAEPFEEGSPVMKNPHGQARERVGAEKMSMGPTGNPRKECETGRNDDAPPSPLLPECSILMPPGHGHGTAAKTKLSGKAKCLAQMLPSMQALIPMAMRAGRNWQLVS